MNSQMVSRSMACGALFMMLALPQPSAAEDMPSTLNEADDSATEMPPSLSDDAPPASPDYDDTPPIRFEGSLSAVVGYPFSAPDAEISFGFGVTYGIGYGEIPLLLGLDFGMLNASASSGALTVDQGDEGGRTLATQDAHTRTFYFDAFLRLQPPNWAVRPYVEGVIGTKLVQSRFSVALPSSDASGADSDPTTLDAHAWAESFGFGAGVDLWGAWNSNGAISLTFGIRQLYGADAHFARGVVIDGHSASARSTMPTTITLLMFGLMGRFDLNAHDDPYSIDRP